MLGSAESWVVVMLDGDVTSTYLWYSEIEREVSRTDPRCDEEKLKLKLKLKEGV